MRTIEQTIYTFEELSEDAKEKARDWWREVGDLNWCDEAKDSIQTFCDYFGVALKNWNIGPYAPIDYHAEYFNSHFRGMKLRDFKRDNMPTGYCLDCSLWVTFYDEFKRTGSAKTAFDAALYQGFKDWKADLEGQMENDYIDEHLIVNQYEFTENGERY